jgi:CheY-like chemotaxis protein
VTVESPDWGLTACVDPTRVHQIITNLVSNAIKFTPSGGRVTLRAARIRPSAAPPDAGSGPREAADWAEIVVADTGVGIRPEDLGRLFRPFEQLQNRLRRSHEGTGLGLALTRRLVELHGGHILAESPGPNLGSTFTVRFPLDGRLAGRTVAVVEDDPGMLHMVAECLKEAGYRVVLASNAAEGSRLLSARPDLLILDLLLPDRSGKEVLKEVRGQPETRDLPVLVISGSTEVSADELRAAGADEFLTKPFSPTVLTDTVSRLLGGSGRRGEADGRVAALAPEAG